MRERFDHAPYRAHVERSPRCLDDLKTRGVDALSPYDIEIAHQGDAEQALCTAKWLVGNHVAFVSRKLEERGPEVIQITLFDIAETEKDEL